MLHSALLVFVLIMNMAIDANRSVAIFPSLPEKDQIMHKRRSNKNIRKKNYSNASQNLFFGTSLEATKRRAGAVDIHLEDSYQLFTCIIN